MFGGCPKWEWGKSHDAQQKLAKTAVLDFGEQNTHDISAFIYYLLVACLYLVLLLICLNRKRKLVITLDIRRPYKP